MAESDKKDTAFKDAPKADEPEKQEVLFNRGSEDGSAHGHVVTSDDGQTTHYARDPEGSVYVDDSKDAPKDKS
jgi:hypothetical protein